MFGSQNPDYNNYKERKRYSVTDEFTGLDTAGLEIMQLILDSWINWRRHRDDMGDELQ